MAGFYFILFAKIISFFDFDKGLSNKIKIHSNYFFKFNFILRLMITVIIKEVQTINITNII